MCWVLFYIQLPIVRLNFSHYTRDKIDAKKDVHSQMLRAREQCSDENKKAYKEAISYCTDHNRQCDYPKSEKIIVLPPVH